MEMKKPTLSLSSTLPAASRWRVQRFGLLPLSWTGNIIFSFSLRLKSRFHVLRALLNTRFITGFEPWFPCYTKCEHNDKWTEYENNTCYLQKLENIILSWFIAARVLLEVPIQSFRLLHHQVNQQNHQQSPCQFGEEDDSCCRDVTLEDGVELTLNLLWERPSFNVYPYEVEYVPAIIRRHA